MRGPNWQRLSLGRLGPSQDPTPLSGPSVPALPCPTPTCHLPGPWGSAPHPSCWVCSCDAPAAMSQNTESQGHPRVRVGGADPTVQEEEEAMGFGTGRPHFSHLPSCTLKIPLPPPCSFSEPCRVEKPSSIPERGAAPPLPIRTQLLLRMR